MAPSNHVHGAAASGFESGAATYARGRPDFPPRALDWLREDLALQAGKAVIDLGAGTGKFTQSLLATGAQVTAIEPVAAMRAHLTQSLPQVVALTGEAQRMPVPDGSADVVICAQAFHWFATADALQEIRRVLKPKGALGLIWNVRDTRVDWVARLTDIMAPYEGDAPRYDNGEWRRVFPAPGFGASQERTFPHFHVGSPERVIVDRVASVSFIAALPERTRAQVLDEVRALIQATPALAGRDEVRFPYVTNAYWCRRIARTT